jgi:multidrug efflux pump subunit AcrB
MENALVFLRDKYHYYDIGDISSHEYIELRVIPERLALYQVEQSQLFSVLKSALNQYQIGILRSRSLYVPIVMSDVPKSIDGIFRDLKVTNRNREEIPVGQLVTVHRNRDYKVLHGGKEGEFVKIPFQKVTTGHEELAQSVRTHLQEQAGMNVSFTGSVFSSWKLLRELLLVLMIALLLLYFILAAQFESFTQPLIVLLEIPIDIAGALALLWLGGGTINLMAMIGIVVMSGIIINDSILKIDTINRLRREGMGLMEAIETGGQRRLNAILMTSLTTILAIVPFLFSNDIGSLLQQPLSLTLIGGMVLGTAVSLYFVPLWYYYLHRKNSEQ